MNATTINIKDHVTAGDCTFVCARAGNLWYRTALGFDFPVPFEEIGDATFERTVKGLLMMRYIRKQAAFANEARQQQTELG